MKSDAKTPRDYLERLPDDRKRIAAAQGDIILRNFPAGFEELINSGMLVYLVTRALYLQGSHSDPMKPLPFMNILNYLAGSYPESQRSCGSDNIRIRS